jgi:hypothetical protein
VAVGFATAVDERNVERSRPPIALSHAVGGLLFSCISADVEVYPDPNGLRLAGYATLETVSLPYRNASSRLTQNIDRVYHRIDHCKGVREAYEAKGRCYRELESTLDGEQRPQFLKVDDAFHEERRACENAYFHVGFASGQLLGEKANRLSPRE